VSTLAGWRDYSHLTDKENTALVALLKYCGDVDVNSPMISLDINREIISAIEYPQRYLSDYLSSMWLFSAEGQSTIADHMLMNSSSLT